MESSGRIVWAIAREKLRLTRGFHALTAIAYGAPAAGVLLTCFGIVGSFKPVIGNPDWIFVRTFYDLSAAIIPTAVGLFIGICSMMAQRYLRSQVEALVFEMIWYRAKR